MSHIEAKYCAHTGQIYAMVLSMGATRTWALVASDSGRFAATALVCGRGDLYTAKSFAGTSIWVFDGTKNPTVPIYESQRMVDALRVVGGVPGLAVCPNATHDSWAPGSSDPKFYGWMLRQMRYWQKQDLLFEGVCGSGFVKLGQGVSSASFIS